jgi:ATP-dependent Clp protease ATP-binding subunit ClpA
VRRLEKIFLPVVVNAMSDTEVKVIVFEPLSAKRQRELLENRIKKLQDRHKTFRGIIRSGGK